MTINSSFSHKIARQDFESRYSCVGNSAATLCRDTLNPAAVKDSNRFERIPKLIFQSLTQRKLACNPSRNMGNSGVPWRGRLQYGGERGASAKRHDRCSSSARSKSGSIIIAQGVASHADPASKVPMPSIRRFSSWVVPGACIDCMVSAGRRSEERPPKAG